MHSSQWSAACYNNHFSNIIDTMRRDGLYRTFATLERLCGQFPHALLHNGQGAPKQVIVWCANDYLGLSQHSEVRNAMHEAIESYGAGAGGTRNISGTSLLAVKLEEEIAEWHGKEAALIFGSGYVTNDSALTALIKLLPDCEVFSDAKNHASMIMGIRRNKPATHVFAHNDVDDLRRLLADAPVASPKIVAFESVYSMEGTIAPIADIVQAAQDYGAITWLDEVHAVGLYGERGSGIAERDGIAQRIDLIQGTFGKAFGVIGGYVAGKKQVIDAIRGHASGLIFSTALPPVALAGARAALRVLKGGQELRKRHQRQADRLRAGLIASGLPVMPSKSHIVPVRIGGSHCCKGVAEALLNNYAIYVQPINYPTVQKGEERLRFTPTPLHTDEMIDDLICVLGELWDQHGLQRLAA